MKKKCEYIQENAKLRKYIQLLCFAAMNVGKLLDITSLSSFIITF